MWGPSKAAGKEQEGQAGKAKFQQASWRESPYSMNLEVQQSVQQNHVRVRRPSDGAKPSRVSRRPSKEASLPTVPTTMVTPLNGGAPTDGAGTSGGMRGRVSIEPPGEHVSSTAASTAAAPFSPRGSPNASPDALRGGPERVGLRRQATSGLMVSRLPVPASMRSAAGKVAPSPEEKAAAKEAARAKKRAPHPPARSRGGSSTRAVVGRCQCGTRSLLAHCCILPR